MTTTGSRMAVIQSSLGFVECEAASKNGVNPPTIKSIPEDNILMSLVSYSMSVNTRQSWPESLGLEIYDDISIPKIIGADEEKGFIG
jgi:hypothetical protein